MAAASRVPAPTVALDEVRRLYHLAEEAEAKPDRGRYVDALKAFLAGVESHKKTLEESGGEVAGWLDETALALYRLSQPDLAARAADIGLALAPGASQLLHHKALILLAQNRNVADSLPILDKALEANPHDKAIWATKGDALKILGRPNDAVDAYLHAQKLDATSTQYVERALKLAPTNAAALQLKLSLARAHGGDRQALEACDALLTGSPNDPALLLARAEILTSLGEFPSALDALGKLGEKSPPSAAALRARLLATIGKTDEAVATYKGMLDGTVATDGASLASAANDLEKLGAEPELVVKARLKLRELEPGNLANLQRLIAVAERLKENDLGILAAQSILEVSPQSAQARRALAGFYLASNRPDEAFREYRTLVQEHPAETADLPKAIDSARSLGRGEDVELLARALARADPDDRDAQAELARALESAGKKEEALAAYDALLSRHPGHVDYLLSERSLLIELGKTDRLPAVYDELFRLDPTRSDLALERGNLYLAAAFDLPDRSAERTGAARAALVSYERASIDSSFATRALLGIARASRLVGDPERAARAYREFLTVTGNEGRADVRKELGHSLRELGRSSDAEAEYDQAVRSGLEDVDLFWGEVEVLTTLNQEAKALRFTELLLQHEPKNPLYLRRKGQLLLKSGKRAEGLEALKLAVGAAPGDARAQFEVGEALRSVGAYADAVAFFRQGLAIDPKSRGGRIALAETLVLAGQPADAVPILDQLLKDDANDPAGWKARADAYRVLGRPAEVAYSLKAILLLEPHNAVALLEKYRLHLAQGEKGDAFEALSQLLKLGGAESQDASLLLQHADLAADLGRTDEANKSYERGAQLDPSQRAEIALRRARVRLAAGRPDLALATLDETLGTAGADGRSVSVLLLRAEILIALERPGEAQSVYEEVRGREPKSPIAISGVARAMLDQGKHAEAKAFLGTAMPQVPADAKLFLLLAEADSGLGSLPDAVATVKRGVQTLPKSSDLWRRLGDLYVAQEAWSEAAPALAHAIAIDGKNAELLLRAGFVAEKLGHPNDALALYDHATAVSPSSKHAWVSRGVALLAVGRPDEAQSSFDRALALDSDFGPAKDGKKAAQQRTRDAEVERYGREALLLESRLGRPITKNDLFVTLHAPFDVLEPVLTAIGRPVRIDLDRLAESELKDLESASYHLINAALERRPPGVERRGLSLADVAALSPPTTSLPELQRTFGYLRSVLEYDLKPENLKLTPDVEELARRALALPENERTLFQLVRNLRVGIFKARLIKAVESVGGAAHAPLPSLDLGQYSPEFRSAPSVEPAPAEDVDFFPTATPSVVPATSVAAPMTPAAARPSPAAGHARCVGCGGIASIRHQCGATICKHCIHEFKTCPKCQLAVTPSSSEPISADGPPAGTTPAAHGSRAAAFSLRTVFGRGKSAPSSSTPHEPTPPKATGHSAPAHPTARAPARPASTERGSASGPAKGPDRPHDPHRPARPPSPLPVPDEDDDEEPEEAPARPARVRTPADDEPRL